MKSPEQQTFVTPRLIVRPRELSDLEACRQMDMDPEVHRFVPGPWHDRVEHERFLTSRLSADYGPNLGYWSVVRKEEPLDFLGWVFLTRMAEGNGLEMGWRFVKSAWGGGVATEAARPVLEHTSLAYPTSPILAFIAPENIGSKRVAEKLGLRATGAVQDGEHVYASERSGETFEDCA